MNNQPVPCRIIPHEQYIKVMILSGMSQEDIAAQTSCEGFNILPDNQFERILEICKSMPDGKKMIAENIKNQKTGAGPFISDKILKEFKYEEYFNDLVYQCLSVPQSKYKHRQYQGITSILADRRVRTFLEISVIINMNPEEIKKGWRKLTGTAPEKHINSRISCYYYYYWRFTMANMRMHSAKKSIDIVSYLNIDPINQFYYPHRQMVFSSAEVLLSYFGLFSDDDRRRMEKEEYGRCHQMIMSSFDSRSFALPPWILSEHERIAVDIGKNEGVEGKDYYIDQLNKIFRRMVVRTDEHTLSEINKNKRRLERQPEKDEPYK